MLRSHLNWLWDSKIMILMIRHAKHILSQTGFGKLRKFSRINFYTEKSFMSNKSKMLDYYNTIIRFIREMLKENKFYLKVSKNLFKSVFKRVLNKKMNTRTKGILSPTRLPIIVGQRPWKYQPKPRPNVAAH